MANIVYNSFKTKVMAGEFNLSAADPSGYNLVLTSGYSPSATDSNYSEVSSFETTGTGYTAGGKELTSMTLTQDDTNNRGVWDADDVEFPESTITADGAILYKTSNGDLICFVDFGIAKSSSSGTFKIAWNTNGILALN